MLCIAACASVLRLPEDYSIQPAYFVILILPIYLTLRTGFSLRYKASSLIPLMALVYFSVVDLVYGINSLIFPWSVSYCVYWLIATFYVMALSSSVNRDLLQLYVGYMVLFFSLSCAFAIGESVVNYPARASGLSGTPNHLGLAAVMLTLITSILRTKQNVFFKVLISAGPLVGLSRAYLVFFILNALRGLTLRNGIFLLFFIFLLSLGLAMWSESIPDLEYIYSRYNFFENSSDEGGRGLARIWLHYENFLFGAGQIQVEYTGDQFSGMIHNNFLALAFNYGIVGVIFSVWIIISLLHSAGLWLTAIFFLFSLGLYFFSNIYLLLLVAVLVGEVNRTKASVA